MQPRTIQEVFETHKSKLMSIPGVVGTAIGEKEGEPCIRVLVARKTSELAEKIPEEIEGYPVIVQETGEIRALDKN